MGIKEWFKSSKQETVERIVESSVRRVITSELSGLRDRLSQFQEIGALTDERNRLAKQVEDLKLSRDREKETSERTTREIEHKLGLHKAQVEFEVVKARDEAKIEIEKTNLDTERKQFEEHTKFIQKQMQDQVEHLRGIIDPLLAALPSADIIARIGNAGGNGSSEKSD
jgi:DNA repair exonuclease SbcCD ATPase subunit